MPRLDHWPARWTTRAGSIYYRTTTADRGRFDGRTWFRLGRTEAEAWRTWHERLPELAAPRTIRDVIERYRVARLPALAAPTRRQYSAALVLLDAVFGGMAPRSLLPVHCYDYRARRPRVAGNRELAVLSAVMSYAVELGAVDRNLVREVRRNPEPPRRRFVEDHEVAAFLAGASPFLRAYVRLKLLTGIRQGQLLALRLSDWDGERLRVEPTKGGRETYYQGDGLEEAVAEVLALRRGAALRSVYLFATRQGQRYTGDGFRSIWQRAMRRYVAAGGVAYTEHDLRAKVASEDPANAMERLQHRSPAMVRTVYNRKPAEVHVLRSKHERSA